MIYNMRRRKKKKQLTWLFSNSLYYEASEQSKTFSANFESAGRAWVGIKINITARHLVGQMWYLNNNGNPYLARVSVFTATKGFENGEYRTIIFDEEPTGELLAFLQANATPL